MKKVSFFFLSENFQFLVVKFSIYLNKSVFLMLFLPFSKETATRVGPKGVMPAVGTHRYPVLPVR